MANGLESVVFTTELTDGILRIVQDMGVQQVSIYNTTATAGTVKGSRSLGSIASTSLSLAEGQTVTFQAIEASVIFSLDITAPAGCTLQIVAQ